MTQTPTDSGPDALLAGRMEPITPWLVGVLKALRSSVRSAWCLATVTLSPFQREPARRSGITRDWPSGKIGSESLGLCKDFYIAEFERGQSLQSKAWNQVALVAVVLPLVISALAAARIASAGSMPLGMGAGLCALLSLALLLLAFVAAFRALSVRAREALFHHTIVDAETGSVRQHDDDYVGRGYLSCTAYNASVHDLVADFVRASWLFTGIAVGMLLAAATLGLYQSTKNAPGPSNSERLVLAADRAANEVESLRAALSRQARDSHVASARRAIAADRVASEVESLRVALVNQVSDGRIDSNTARVEELLRRIASLEATLATQPSGDGVTEPPPASADED